jgi:hypothetical protein
VGASITRSDGDGKALEELHLCQAALDTLTMRTWQSTGIILAGAMATLGLMLQVSADELAAAIITSLFGFGGVLVLYFWLSFVQRERRIQRRLIRRMRDLELQLQFSRQSLMKDAEVPAFDQSRVLTATTYIVGSGWLVVIAWRWLLWAGAID